MAINESLFAQWDKVPQSLLDKKQALDGGPKGWRPNRLILQNYWLFSYEEFHFVHGRLVLRGANTTGKSTVLVSAITLALDGEKRRERLDTFGGQGRGIAYYLVGHPDATEDSDYYYDDRTAYVALEFEKPQTGEMMTIGVGLYTSRNRANLAVDSWGFAITDGRRIGQDFHLFGDDRVPLTQRQLVHRLDTGGTVVDRASDYQELVNRLLFGFDTQEEYEFLLQLLLQLRSPKLNKDTKPSMICEMLTASLPPLPSDLLTQVTQIIDDIDSCLEDIEDTDGRLQAVTEIDDRFSHYLNQLAQLAAFDYQQAQDAVDRAVEKRAEIEGTLQQHRVELDHVQERLAGILTEQQTVNGRIEGLEQHEAFKDRRNIEALEKDLTAAERAQSRAEVALDRSKQVVERLAAQRQALLEEWEGLVQELQSQGQAIAEEVQQAQWDHAYQYTKGIPTALQDIPWEKQDAPDIPIPVGPLEEAGGRRLSLLEQVIEALRGVEKAQHDHELGQGRLKEAEVSLQEADRQVQRASEMLENGRSGAIAAYKAWRATAEVFQAELEVDAAVEEAIHHYPKDETGTTKLYRAAIDPAQSIERHLNNQERRLGVQRDKDKEELKGLRDELAAWEGTKDPAPQRRESQEQARRVLTEAGIQAVPLYSACEFRDDVPKDLAAQLEQTLDEAELLDGLVVEPSEAQRVESLLADAGLGDRWLRPAAVSAPRTQYDGWSILPLSDILRPVNDHPQEKAIEAALANVGWIPGEWPSGDIPFPAAVSVDAWQVGPLSGTATRRKTDAIFYIGETNRRRHREAIMTRLKQNIAAAEEALWNRENDLDAVRSQIERLRREMDALQALPVWEALHRAALGCDQAREWFASRRRAMEQVERQAESAYRSLVQARTVYEERLGHIPEARGRNENGIRDLMERTRQVIHLVKALKKGTAAITKLRRRFRTHAADQKAAAERVVQDRESLDEATSQVQTLSGRRAAILEHLESLDISVAELLQELHVLKDRAKELLGAERKLLPKEGRLQEMVQRAERELAEGEQAAAQLNKVVNERVGNLRTALNAYPSLTPYLKLLDSEDQGPKVAAQELLKLRRAETERLRDAIEKGIRESLQVLTGTFSDHRSTLVEHSPLLTDMGMVTFRELGTTVPPFRLRDKLSEDLAIQRNLLRETESKLYENVILREVARVIRERMTMAEHWRDEVNGLLESKELSNGEVLSISWRPKPEDRLTGTNIARVIELLRRDLKTLTDDEIDELVNHFRRQVGEVRQRYKDNTLVDKTFADALGEVLDYRHWFSFSLHSKLPRENRRDLTDTRFASRSGAEKSLAMFIPILAAVYARYNAAVLDAPRLVGIDEAFAGVDEQNIREMFRFLVELNFSWIMTSEKLWGLADTLPGCSTYELVKSANVITPIWYVWDGSRRHDALSAG